ncbi:hypothetical protein HYR54_15875 [Candidatus Acetothermia bacterium]|nr:hypothetical protein [Candidatus Acetothermia bacterium]
MQDIKSLMDVLGMTENQVRTRIDRFKPVLNGSVRKGSFNRVLIDNNGVAVLQRVKELEGQGYDFDHIQITLESETARAQPSINRSEPDQRGAEPLPLPLVMQSLQERIESLETQLKEKDKQIVWFQQILENRILQLPPPREGIDKASRLTRFKQFIVGK